MGLRVECVLNGGLKATGTVRYVGPTDFQTGTWIGVELEDGGPLGKNDGKVQGKRYFSCPTSRGVFVKPDKVEPLRQHSSRGSRAGSAGRPCDRPQQQPPPPAGGLAVGPLGRRQEPSSARGGSAGRRREDGRSAGAGRRAPAGSGVRPGGGSGLPSSGRRAAAEAGSRLPSGAAAAMRNTAESEAGRRRRMRAERNEHDLDRARDAALLQLDMMGRQNPLLPWEAAAARSEEQTYRVCSPAAFGMPEMERGDKVCLPQSLLEHLLRTSVNLQVAHQPTLSAIRVSTAHSQHPVTTHGPAGGRTAHARANALPPPPGHW